MDRLIVDGMNVLGSRPDGWWRDRPAAMAGLTRRLSALAAGEAVEIRVVFDGRPHRRVEAAADGIELGFAPGGPDAADRAILAVLRSDPEPAAIVVVTQRSPSAQLGQGRGRDQHRLERAAEAPRIVRGRGQGRSGRGLGSVDGTTGADRRTLDSRLGPRRRLRAAQRRHVLGTGRRPRARRAGAAPAARLRGRTRPPPRSTTPATSPRSPSSIATASSRSPRWAGCAPSSASARSSAPTTSSRFTSGSRSPSSTAVSGFPGSIPTGGERSSRPGPRSPSPRSSTAASTGRPSGRASRPRPRSA